MKLRGHAGWQRQYAEPLQQAQHGAERARALPAPANAEGQLLRQVAVTSPCMRVQVRKKLNWFLPYLDPRAETYMHQFVQQAWQTAPSQQLLFAEEAAATLHDRAFPLTLRGMFVPTVRGCGDKSTQVNLRQSSDGSTICQTNALCSEPCPIPIFRPVD